MNAARSSGSDQVMTNLLKVASAKFVMLLTGLFCSILFRVWLRIRTDKVERALVSRTDASILG